MSPDRPDRPAASSIFVSEIFSAIQGEAALVGTRQVFLRLTGCNIRCSYCDQPEALERRAGPCRIEQTPGRRDWTTVASPVPLDAVADAVLGLWRSLPHHSLSVTGGEPLLQADRLAELLVRLEEERLPVMLETNGMLARGLDRVIERLTYVSMDLKLPSVDGVGVDPMVHHRFLRAALDAGIETWVKIVIGATTDERELVEAVDLVAAAAAGRSVPVPVIYLQPVTPFGQVTVAPDPATVLALHEVALRRYPSVRVVPQTHKAIGQL